ncbi:GrpB family protein [Saccharothrix sp.]|uniref:GrpB family protein n=1 Tax=Saccharothrix sp. TaxID=1873460 RepID=UPI0028119900|nr:GrpB family protein [Saccharothrix sp.]
MRIEVIAGPEADRVAAQLRAHDTEGLLTVTAVNRPGPAALVIGEDVPLSVDIADLWTHRVRPMARRLAGLDRAAPAPAVLHPHDPALPRAAEVLLNRLRTALHHTDDGRWTYDHIGSTAVPDLRAKRFIDLQIGATTLPDRGVDDRLATTGFLPAKGSRPDSPGVHHDLPIGGQGPTEVYRKRLYVRPDPAAPAILHFRLLDSPWCAATTSFRDRLRADAATRRAYEEVKERAARDHAGDPDYDDYTRSKSAFITGCGRRLTADESDTETV